ncbi:MAG: DEAD/DEAH box helicase [Desulfopila sp.]|jgi:superfamily II DNA or RNA helicase|nr:DEAD/DEAH box helicase [Desulfopila sp.]
MKDIVLTVSNDCLLENIPLEFERILKKELTIDNPRYIAAKRYGRWVGSKLQAQLKYYEQVPTGLRFPRGFSNQAVLLCRDHLQISPRIRDKRRLLPARSFSFSGELRAYQEKAVAEIGARSFGVLEAGTGSGKTIMALALVAQRCQPVLVVVHTKELLYQWRDRIEEFLGIRPGLIGDGHRQVEVVTVAIVNSARKMVDELVPLFGHLIVDECHRVPAALFTDVVSAFDCHYLLGLSATAFRSDDQTTRLIYFYMGDPVHKVDQGMLAASGAIVQPKILVKKTAFDYPYRGDYQALITALTSHQGRNRQILEDIAVVVREGDSGTTLVVSDRISHCEVFAEALQKKGFRVALLTGQTGTDQRGRLVEEVQKGEVQVLVATLQLIGEGFDCPGLSTLFLTTPITFEGRLVQIIGRIMRPAKDKQPRVFDYLDHNVSALRKSANLRHKTLRRLMEPSILQE